MKKLSFIPTRILFGWLLFIALGITAGATYRLWQPLILPSDTTEEGHAEDDHDEHSDEETIKLTPQARENLKLKFQELSHLPYWRKVSIPGVLVDRPGETDRTVGTKVSAIVSKIYARPGDVVEADQPLFELQIVSEFAQSTQVELVKSIREQELAKVHLEKIMDGVRLGTKTQLDAFEQQKQLQRWELQIGLYRRQLGLFGFTQSQIEQVLQGNLLTTITISAPPLENDEMGITSTGRSKGEYEVQELKVQVGQHVIAGDPLCILSNHEQLFVEARFFTSEQLLLANAVAMGGKIELDTHEPTMGITWPNDPAIRFHHYSNEVEIDSRTVGAYFLLENEARSEDVSGKKRLAWRFRPGQHVHLHVPVEFLGKELFVVPIDAIVREGANAYVFRENGAKLQRVEVQLKLQDSNNAVIVADGSLGVGQSIAVNQAPALNRILKAGNAGDDHGHDHDHDH
ncbi:MAG: efflux RND transporter periplasmic adaptor subunit [Zavarzinella sp.]